MYTANFFCHVHIACRLPRGAIIAAWTPPAGVFTEHEQDALLRQSPLVASYKRCTVQGFAFAVFNQRVRYDSSVVWVNDEKAAPFLVRVMRFISVAPCCNADCQPVTLAEIRHFEVSRDAEGRLTASIRERARLGYVGAETLKPQVVMLIPVISDIPSTYEERRDARHTMLYGPFYVVSIARKKYQ